MSDCKTEYPVYRKMLIQQISSTSHNSDQSIDSVKTKIDKNRRIVNYVVYK